MDTAMSLAPADATINAIDKAVKDMMDKFGVTPASTEASTVTKAIQGVTEDTARRLEGLINSIRETGVNNLTNIKSLVQSNQMIQAYSAESLGTLRNIDITTTKHLSAFSELISAGHVKGGNGLKVFA